MITYAVSGRIQLHIIRKNVLLILKSSLIVSVQIILNQQHIYYFNLIALSCK